MSKQNKPEEKPKAPGAPWTIRHSDGSYQTASTFETLIAVVTELVYDGATFSVHPS